MNEQAWVARLQGWFPCSRGLGIGDDAAVFPAGEGLSRVVTTDLLVEGVHFLRQTHSLPLLARKLLAVNLSDVAAMGATPTVAFLNLAGSLSDAEMTSFFEALSGLCQNWGVELAGGDLSASPILTLALTAEGQTPCPVLRTGARPRDRLCLSGPCGWSALGLKQLQDGQTDGPFVRAHLEPEPELALGPRLSGRANAMMDLSDGLLLDLQRLCRASGVAAEVHTTALPLDPAFSDACREAGLDPLQTALTGGEDYRLLFTLPPQETLPAGCTVVGRILDAGAAVPGEIRLLGPQGPLPLPSRLGWDHRAPG